LGNIGNLLELVKNIGKANEFGVQSPGVGHLHPMRQLQRTQLRVSPKKVQKSHWELCPGNPICSFSIVFSKQEYQATHRQPANPGKCN